MNAYIINKTECIVAPFMGAAIKEFISINSIEDIEEIEVATRKQLNAKVKFLDESGDVEKLIKLENIIKHVADGEVRYIYGEE